MRFAGTEATRPMLRTAVAATLLLAQAAAILYARRVESRYFCWAPYDTQTDYSLRVALPGRGDLTATEIRRRYRITVGSSRGDAAVIHGHDQRSPQHVKDIVEQYEATYGRDDRAQVVMRYSVNGRETAEWRWP